MLQQTQVNRVSVHYRRFIRKFSTLRSLSQASTATVLKSWRGLGYNNRAVRLRNLAREVVVTMGGRLPRTADALKTLPGIGRYTAGAIACFAHGQRVPVVDTNIQRVLSRLFPGTRGIIETWELAERILPSRNAYAWNQALMELGALICVSASPSCSHCPLKSVCPSAFTVRPARRKLSSKEPGRDGTPNRIYRGRIIEALRNLDGRHSISGERLGKHVKAHFAARDRAWFKSLLLGLERDGLVRTSIRAGHRIVSFAE
jgi:A/G-specific adenine glycosylase